MAAHCSSIRSHQKNALFEAPQTHSHSERAGGILHDRARRKKKKKRGPKRGKPLSERIRSLGLVSLVCGQMGPGKQAQTSSLPHTLVHVIETTGQPFSVIVRAGLLAYGTGPDHPASHALENLSASADLLALHSFPPPSTSSCFHFLLSSSLASHTILTNSKQLAH
jgi:hypothetical protein